MKLAILLIALLIGCHKSEQQPAVLSAEKYMNQISSNSYNSSDLPDLEPSDISFLLKYRNENEKIKIDPLDGTTFEWR